MMKRWPITFALILPLAELCVALLVLTLPALLIFLNLETLAHGTGAAHIEFGQFSQTIPRSDFLSYATQSSAFQSSHALTALNMPGMFGEIIVSLPTTGPDRWYPAGLSLESFRSVIMPLFCLSAWVLAGCGVDAILGWRKLDWSVLLTGTLLCVMFGVFLVGIGIVSLQVKSEREDSSFILCGLSLWTVLFATLPAVWIRRWRSRRAIAKQMKSVIAA
jgi:hypothetical protein